MAAPLWGISFTWISAFLMGPSLGVATSVGDDDMALRRHQASIHCSTSRRRRTSVLSRAELGVLEEERSDDVSLGFQRSYGFDGPNCGHAPVRGKQGHLAEDVP